MKSQQRVNRTLLMLGLVSLFVYAVVAWMSREFAYGQPVTSRPIPAVLLLFAVAFGCYAFALRQAVCGSKNRTNLLVIGLFSLCFRGARGCHSTPLTEIVC